MCMPYFGGANLAQVLEATGHNLSMTAAATGLSLIEALDIVGRPAPSDSGGSTGLVRGGGTTPGQSQPSGARSISWAVDRQPLGR